MSGALRFSWRSLLREWRAGELRVLALALVIAVGSTTAVGFFADRIRQAMTRQAGELLAADLVVESRSELPAVWIVQAEELGLRLARAITFRSVAAAGGGIRLTEVKAAGPGYPLRGAVRIADRPYGEERTVTNPPPPGTVWAEPRLLQELGLSVGDRLELGRSGFRIDAVLTSEPDRGADLFSIAPRLLMNLQDLEATGLLGIGSLAGYRLLLAGEPAALAEYRARIEPRLEPGQRLLGVRDGRPEVSAALDRAERFLGLAALSSVLLAGVAAATAARRYAERHRDAVAVMRCIGASQGYIVRGYGLQLLWLGLIAAAAGTAVGYLAQQGITALLGGLLQGELPPPGAAPVLTGVVTALITLAGFALPPVLALGGVPPLRVLRRDVGEVQVGTAAAYGAAGAALFGLMAWQVADADLVLLVFGGTVAALLVLGLAAWLLVRGVNRLRGRVGVAWRFGLANIGRRTGGSIAQVIAFGLGIMVLLLLAVVRGDLLNEWRATLPAEAPNHFVINVQPDQVAAIRDSFDRRGLAAPGFDAMVRGRLVAIGDRAVTADDYENPRARRLAEREFNLSWAQQLATDNRIVAGRWWGPSPEPDQWSVERGLAETLGIDLGDRLVFNIAGREVSGTVTSLREVNWDSFQTNFFVLAAPGLLDDYPASYITSFYLPADQRPVLPSLVAEFPNITVIDIASIMERVRGIIERVTLAVEFVFGFTIAAGLMVLYAAIQSTLDERRREAALLRTLGASHRTVRAGLLAEFVTIGLLAGVLAAAAATALAAVLATQVFELTYRPDLTVWLAGLLGGGLGVGLAGALGTRAVLRQPPLWTLRGP